MSNSFNGFGDIFSSKTEITNGALTVSMMDKLLIILHQLHRFKINLIIILYIYPLIRRENYDTGIALAIWHVLIRVHGAK